MPSAPIRIHPPKGLAVTAVAAWGVLATTALLISAIVRLTPMALEPLRSHDMSGLQWALLIGGDELPPPRSAEPVTALYNFESSLKSIILAKYQWRQVGEGYNPTVPGNEENRVVMHFNTNESGRPVKVRLVSAFGRDFYQPIKRSLETLTKWQPNQTKLVLTVYVRMGVSTYSYRYNFSLD